MGFFDKVTGALGIGGPKVKLELSESSYSAGGALTGTLVITGGKTVKPINAAELTLYSMRKDKGQNNIDVTVSTSVAEAKIPLNGLQLKEGETNRVPFELSIPNDVDAGNPRNWFELHGGADVPGLDPTDRTKVDIRGAVAGGAKKGNLFDSVVKGAQDLRDARQPYHLLTEERSFRHSSVRGDFRILPIAGGFISSWKTSIIGRNEDGSERFRHARFGKAFAVNADGTRLAAVDDAKGLTVFDAKTGKALTGRLAMPDWIFYVAFLPGGNVLAAGSEALFVVDGQCTAAKPIAGKEGWYVGGLDVIPNTDQALIADSNGSKLYRLAVTNLKFEAEAELRYPHDPMVNKDGTRFSVDAQGLVAVYDAKTLKQVWSHPLPGKEGVRHPGHEEGSSNQWKPLTKLSPDGKRVLVNDRSGQLWVLGLDGTDVAIPRTTVDFVEDAMWADPGHLLVLTNDGEVVKLALAGNQVLFRQQDV